MNLIILPSRAFRENTLCHLGKGAGFSRKEQGGVRGTEDLHPRNSYERDGGEAELGSSQVGERPHQEPLNRSLGSTALI